MGLEDEIELTLRRIANSSEDLLGQLAAIQTAYESAARGTDLVGVTLSSATVQAHKDDARRGLKALFEKMDHLKKCIDMSRNTCAESGNVIDIEQREAS